MSIPAEFRRVLETNDPDWTEGRPAIVHVVYGDHLKHNFQAYTVSAFSEIAAAIMSLRPKTPEETKQKDISKRLMLGQSVRLEVDKDGRVVLPLPQRQKLGLTEGEVKFSGAGDHFEVWAADTYDAKVGVPQRAYVDQQDDGWDPMTGIWSALGS